MSISAYFHHPDRYDRTLGRFLHRLHARVIRDVIAANLAEGSRILDVGTGPGRVPHAVANALPQIRIAALDLSPQMVEQARHRATTAERPAQLGFVVGDVASLPYPGGTFDLIISSMSQHHWTDPPAALRELRRVLRPAGRLWIYDVRRRLPRAETAARTLFPEHTVHSEPLRNGRLPLHITARLTIEPA